MKKELNRLEAAHGRYESAISAMEAKIKSLVDFGFSINYQESDGFVLADMEANNAHLDSCLEIIKEKGRLSQEDYEDILI